MARFDLTGEGIAPLTLQELFRITNEGEATFWHDFLRRPQRLSVEPSFQKAVSHLYPGARPSDITPVPTSWLRMQSGIKRIQPFFENVGLEVVSASDLSYLGLPGLDLGWLAGGPVPQDLPVPAFFSQCIGTLALNHVDALRRRAQAILDANLEQLDDWVQSEQRLSFREPPELGTAVIRIDTGSSVDGYVSRLEREAGVRVERTGPCLEVNYGILAPEEFRDAVVAMGRLFVEWVDGN